ncbi:hypothetical protein EDC01DRAFT_636151 [Geopyxis carbonaria]|nr:hypothetical protein EDC01DRAFT_636151 [Geopyxis carbonaria]
MPRYSSNVDLSKYISENAIPTSTSIYKRTTSAVPAAVATSDQLFNGQFGDSTGVGTHPLGTRTSTFTTLGTSASASSTVTNSVSKQPELWQQAPPYNFTHLVYILVSILAVLMLLGLSLCIVRQRRNRRKQEMIYQTKLEAETAMAQTRLEKEAEAEGRMEEVRIS